MRVVFIVVSALGLAACIDSPNLELVDAQDASTSSSDGSDAGTDAENATDTSTPPKPKDPPPKTPTCDGRCAMAGGTCTNDVCTFTCPGSAACNRDIKCPPGMACSVSCTGKEACNGTVECKDATSCTIACDGDSACKGRVSCSGAQCAITCTQGSCKVDDIRCCATACTLNGAPLTCP